MDVNGISKAISDDRKLCRNI